MLDGASAGTASPSQCSLLTWSGWRDNDWTGAGAVPKAASCPTGVTGDESMARAVADDDTEEGIGTASTLSCVVVRLLDALDTLIESISGRLSA